MATRGRILLVDDEPLVLEMFEDVFSQKGYDVVVASTAKEAIKQVNRLFFDVLVSDVKLDGLDGFDLLSIARRKSKSVEVILITGAPSDKDAKRAASLNAVYLSKPVGLTLMIDTVNEMMQRCAKRLDKIRGKKSEGVYSPIVNAEKASSSRMLNR